MCYTVQVTSSSMQLIKLLPTIFLMWRQQTTFYWKLPLTFMTLSLQPILSSWSSLRLFCLFPSPPRVNSFLSRMMPQYQRFNPTFPSLVLKPPQYCSNYTFSEKMFKLYLILAYTFLNHTFLKYVMVAAFSLDISVFLSLPCTFEVYLRRWSFLEGGLG